MSSVLFCDGCRWLSVTEEDQNRPRPAGVNFRPPHWCSKYDEQVRHLGYHPHIVILSQCNSWQPANNAIQAEQLALDADKALEMQKRQGWQPIFDKPLSA